MKLFSILLAAAFVTVIVLAITDNFRTISVATDYGYKVEYWDDWIFRDPVLRTAYYVPGLGWYNERGDRVPWPVRDTINKHRQRMHIQETLDEAQRP